MSLHAALEPPLDEGAILEAVPELYLARDVGQGPFHHLDAFEHTLQVIRRVERELEENTLGTQVPKHRASGLRVAAVLHDAAKPLTRGEVEGRVLFVAHDSLGAGLVRRVCRRLGLCAPLTDLAATLTALHLKIGFMERTYTDYPPARLARAAGPFGEELALLSWADRLAAQGPRLKPEHIERHRGLCVRFLRISRDLGPYAEPDYSGLADRLASDGELADADVGYAASYLRLLRARGLGEEATLLRVSRSPRARGRARF
ncbi:MAG: HD domain-containing protein [Actinomycetota bacterium]|nr:HD domain-containing protein [Actinomycetota bacterium]MDQ5817822.1 HD domain-containing protein [Actinomycetota bacterium]